MLLNADRMLVKMLIVVISGLGNNSTHPSLFWCTLFVLLMRGCQAKQIDMEIMKYQNAKINKVVCTII